MEKAAWRAVTGCHLADAVALIVYRWAFSCRSPYLLLVNILNAASRQSCASNSLNWTPSLNIAMDQFTTMTTSVETLPMSASTGGDNSSTVCGTVGSDLTGKQVANVVAPKKRTWADEILENYRAAVKDKTWTGGLGLYALEYVQCEHDGVTLTNTGQGKYRIVWKEGGVEQRVNLGD